MRYRKYLAAALVALGGLSAQAETFPDSAYTVPSTYINPVIAADFPDITLFKDGSDFYACNSSFHFAPYCAIYHSTDLVHWQVISRAVPPTWPGLISDAPGAGIWQGAITKFYGSWWLYFSNTAGGGQYFTKASSPSGPWSAPVKVNTTASTGAIGYDNSVFVDDDGTPYMLTKCGQFIAKIQEIGRDGHLTGEAIDMGWANADKRYSWAEGPVMCKRDGWYYYFVAGNVAGGQWTLRTKDLRGPQSGWEELGPFFQTVTDAGATLRSPNHISQPFQIADGTWWCLAHSYETGDGDWSGKGRQGLLHQVVWDSDGVPHGVAPTSQPVMAPALSNGRLVPWALVRSDDFTAKTRASFWHFLSKGMAAKALLTTKRGWLTLSPGSATAHILQKEAAHNGSVTTCVRAELTASDQQAGLYLTNGNESKALKLALGYDGRQVVTLTFGDDKVSVPYAQADSVWLRLVRVGHQVTSAYSADGIQWSTVATTDVSDLDKSQDNYNSWVGNSIGLFAERHRAMFSCFVANNGFDRQLAYVYNNAFGVETVKKVVGTSVTNTTDKGGWLMMGGLDFGTSGMRADSIRLRLISTKEGTVELWADDIERQGTLLGTVNTKKSTATKPYYLTLPIDSMGGQHDLYLRFKAPAKSVAVYSVQLIQGQGGSTAIGAVTAGGRTQPAEVYDTSGRLRGRAEGNGQVGRQLERLPKGIYIIKNGTTTYKRMKR